MTGGPSKVSTRKAGANETFIRKSKKVYKSVVRIVACQLYPYFVSGYARRLIYEI